MKLTNQNKQFGLKPAPEAPSQQPAAKKDLDDQTMRSKSTVSNVSHLDNQEPAKKKPKENEGGFFGNPDHKPSTSGSLFGNKTNAEKT